MIAILELKKDARPLGVSPVHLHSPLKMLAHSPIKLNQMYNKRHMTTQALGTWAGKHAPRAVPGW